MAYYLLKFKFNFTKSNKTCYTQIHKIGAIAFHKDKQEALCLNQKKNALLTYLVNNSKALIEALYLFSLKGYLN